MKIQRKLSKQFSSAATIMALVAVMGVPIMSSAESVVTAATVHIDSSSLSSRLSKPTISGTATGMKKVKITVRKEIGNKIVFTKSSIKVKNDMWRTKVSKKLADGNYIVTVSGTVSGKKTTTTETLVIGDDVVQNEVSSKSTLAVGSIPLLSGGNVRAGATVPISYLQITNTGKDPISLKGFWVRQNGSAQAESVIGLSAVDDKSVERGSVGGNEGAVLFKNGQAFVPADMTFAPGEMRLFTIKAKLTGNVNAHLGKQLMLDVMSVESNAKSSATFPIRGTTWIVAW